ncbi:MAG: SDR family NAD(P)-dependent oxidoreductase, partial [Mesorhizobium sp.]
MALLANKTAIVTGASSGIGRAIALKFAAEGANVVIADTVEQPIEGGESTVELIRAAGGNGVYMKTDISDWNAVDALVGATVDRFGRLDVMVNNAAIYTSTNLVETTPQNLFFTAQDYETQGANLKASPPLRSPHDVDALRAALSAGLIDIVATDHAPHAPAEKAALYAAFADTPGGMPGLQTLLATMLRLVDEGLIALPELVRMCARNPAERFGLGRRKGRIAAGYDADLLILD